MIQMQKTLQNIIIFPKDVQFFTKLNIAIFKDVWWFKKDLVSL